MRVVICGGGVIGASIAFFLALRGIQAVVVEGTDVACGASGKSGGFLALDWCDGSPVGPLARRSFWLHGELAQDLNGGWGYRRLDTLSVLASARRDTGAHGQVPSPDWLAPEAAVRAQLGSSETTAQVDPAAFTRGMLDAAVVRGARLHRGRVTGIALTPDGSAATGALVDGMSLGADAVVIAMGPWSALAAQWLPLPAVYGIKGHSLLLRTDPPLSPRALFVDFEAEDGTMHGPEVMPRPDGTTYVCGLSSETRLPDDPADVAPDAGACERLRAIAARISPALGKAEVLAAQSCYRPIARDGLPLIGRIPGVSGAFVATGHGVWGILNAPATGEAMAALIAGQTKTAVDLTPFDPARLKPLTARRAGLQDR